MTLGADARALASHNLSSLPAVQTGNLLQIWSPYGLHALGEQRLLLASGQQRPQGQSWSLTCILLNIRIVHHQEPCYSAHWHVQEYVFTTWIMQLVALCKHLSIYAEARVPIKLLGDSPSFCVLYWHALDTMPALTYSTRACTKLFYGATLPNNSQFTRWT